MKVLANDGISQSGVDALTNAGIEVITTKVAQEQLVNYINQNNISVLLVRSATTARKELIDACPSLKIIGRGGVGMDNIDVTYAQEKGLSVINTPAASSSSVAELVFAHLFGGVRYLFDSNRNMPLDGDTRFKELKKNYAKGSELRGKTIGIIGFGRIGREVAKIALGCGMKVIASDNYVDTAKVTLDFFDGQKVTIDIKTKPIDALLQQSDFVSLHVPAQKQYIIGKEQIAKMKDGEITYLDSVVVRNPQLQYPLAVFRFSEDVYEALLMKCTHQGTELKLYGDTLQCIAHGSEFDNKGQVTTGPARETLRNFPVVKANQKLFISLK